MYKKMAALAAATSTVLLASFGAMAAPANALGDWQNLPANASCMAFLAAASNPNASGDHIASLAQSGNASTVRHWIRSARCLDWKSRRGLHWRWNAFRPASASYLR